MSERDRPINTCGFGLFVQRLPHSLCGIEGRSLQKAWPCVSQLGHRLYLSPQRLRSHTAIQVKGVFPRAQVVHGAAKFVREYRERLGFAMCVFEFGNIFFSWLTLAEKEHGGFGKRPASMDGADLFAGSPQSFPARFFGALDQTTRGDDILDAGKARDILHLIEKDQGKNLPNPGHRL